MESIECPNCTTKLKVKEEAIGKRVGCPNCETRFVANSTTVVAPRPEPEFDDAAANAETMEFLGPGARGKRARLKSASSGNKRHSRKAGRKTSSKRASAAGATRRNIVILAGVGCVVLAGVTFWLLSGGDGDGAAERQADKTVETNAVASKSSITPSSSVPGATQPKPSPSTGRSAAAKSKTTNKQVTSKTPKSKKRKTPPRVAGTRSKKRPPMKSRAVARYGLFFPKFVPETIRPPEMVMSQRLAKPIDFNAIPLGEVLHSISDDYQLQIVVRDRDLAATGLSLKSHVTAKLSKGQVADGLSAILAPLDLDWTVRDGVVLVTSNDVDSNLHLRVYKIRSGDPKLLQDRIQSRPLVENAGWIDSDGSGGSISMLGKSKMAIINKITVLLKIEQQFGRSLVRIESPRDRYALSLSNVRIPRELLRKQVSFDAIPNSLRKLLAQFGKQFKLEFTIDQKAIDNEGISTEIDSKCRFRGLQTVQILNRILDRLMLTWIPRPDGKIEVTTRDAADRKMFVNHYRVGAPVNQELINAIRSIYPDSWDHNGGNASVSATGRQQLKIAQSFHGHVKIGQMLDLYKRRNTAGSNVAGGGFGSGSQLPLDTNGANEVPVQRMAIIGVPRAVGRKSIGFTPVVSMVPWICSVAVFAPGDQKLVLQSGTTTLEILDHSIWSPRGDGQAGNRTLKHDDPVYDAAFSHDAALLATASGRVAGRGMQDARGRVHFWNPQTGLTVGRPLEFDQRVRRVVFSPDGKQLAVCASNPHPLPSRQTGGRFPESDVVRLYDVKSRKQIGKAVRHIGEVEFLQFSKDGSVLMSAGVSDLHINLRIATNGRVQNKRLKHSAGIADAVLTADGRFVISAGFDGNIIVWNTKTARQVVTIRNGIPQSPKRLGPQFATLMAVSPDGTRIASAKQYGKVIRFWELPTGKRIGNPAQCKEAVTSLQFSPDSSWLLSGHMTGRGPGEAQLWSSETAKAVGPPINHQTRLLRAGFSRDGKWILTWGSGVARLWNAPASRAPLRRR